MKNAVLIFGYNNTRVNDVAKIREKAQQYLNAVTVLCKSAPTRDDHAAADFVIDVGLEATDSNVKHVINECKSFELNVIALLPFSDPGTQLGAAVAKELNLRGPQLEKVRSALDKSHFRKLEAQASVIPRGYKKITSKSISSLDELIQTYNELAGKVFIKPAREGNSRGCIKIETADDITSAWSQVSHYLSGGIVAEELIPIRHEYSWDHVNGYSWITEKQTTQNQYRAEIQQILPAPFSADATQVLTNAGRFMSDLSGSNEGACHNELFYDAEKQIVMGVEPNLRPAGMRIWDLAAIAFQSFDPWKEWLLWAAGLPKEMSKHLIQDYFVGIRMIPAHKAGVLMQLADTHTSTYSKDNIEIVELTWTKRPGDYVTDCVKDNSEFIGFIIAKSKEYSALANGLPIICHKIANEVSIQ